MKGKFVLISFFVFDRSEDLILKNTHAPHYLLRHSSTLIHNIIVDPLLSSPIADT